MSISKKKNFLSVFFLEAKFFSQKKNMFFFSKKTQMFFRIASLPVTN